MNTRLQEWMAAGFSVSVSETINQGEIFYLDNPDAGIKQIVLHPCDYNYAAYPDWRQAHEMNQFWLTAHLDRMANEALERLGQMVDWMNRKDEPAMFTFTGPMEVSERDGFFEFKRPAEYGGESYLIVTAKMQEYGEHALDAAESMYNFGAAFEEPVEPAYLERGSYLGDRIRYGQMLEQEQRNLDAMENRSYDELEEHLGRKPNFEEIVRGY